MKPIVIAVVILALPGAALACPTAAPTSERLASAFSRLATASGDAVAKRHVDQIWQDWTTAPDRAAQDLLDVGMRRIRVADFAGAEDVLTDLITYCPGYAEGWNQRAFARFLQGDSEGALADIEETLTREPKHFGALSGRFRIFLSQGRLLLARRTLDAALEIYPLINDRFLLPPGTKT